MSRRLFFTCLFALFACIQASAQKKVFDRGYDTKKPSAVIAAKNSWSLGGNIGFGTSSQDNYDFLLVKGINSREHSFVATPRFCYMVADNMGVGAAVGYSRAYLGLESASAALGATKIDIRNYNYLGSKYSAAVFFRYYLPFGGSGRWAGYFDAELSGAKSTSNCVDKDGRGGYSEGFSVGLGGYTGIMVLVTKHLGLDVRVGLLEFGYRATKQENNQGGASTQQRVNGSASLYGGNFMVDLMALSFGVHYFL